MINQKTGFRPPAFAGAGFAGMTERGIGLCSNAINPADKLTNQQFDYLTI